MYNTIIMPVDVFEMELSDKAIRHAEFLAQDKGVIHLLHVLPGSASLSLHRFAADVRRFEEHLQHEAEPVCKRWSVTSASILPVLNNMSALAAYVTWSTSWVKS